MASPSSFKMATPSPAKMTSPTCTPAKKRRVDSLTDLITSTGDDLDMQITSCLYHLGKKDVAQATRILEKVRRLMKASNSKYVIKLNEINLEISALNQKINGLEKREAYQSRHIANLQGKIENYNKAFLSFDDDFATDEPSDSSISSHIPIVGSHDSEDSEDSPAKPQMSKSEAETQGTFTQENPSSQNSITDI